MGMDTSWQFNGNGTTVKSVIGIQMKTMWIYGNGSNPWIINSHRHLQCHTIHHSVLHLYLPGSQLRRRVLQSVHTTVTEVTKLL